MSEWRRGAKPQQSDDRACTLAVKDRETKGKLVRWRRIVLGPLSVCTTPALGQWLKNLRGRIGRR